MLTATNRLISLDAFRGFAIFGMIMVNYLGYFEVIPVTFKHPRYGMTFANAIAPYFVFAVGMGLRMSLTKRITRSGSKKAYLHTATRYLTLILIGVILYGPDPVTDMWDALVDIGFAGLFSLPVVMYGKTFRVAYAFLLLIIYQLLFSYTGYGVWTMANSIDGGPLGTLSWTAILLFGTVQMDFLNREKPKEFIKKSIYLGIPLLILGLILSYLEPSENWEFSQRSMTIAYPVFSSGLSVITFAGFYWLADMRKLKIPHLKVLGINPLVIYILQQVLIAFYGDFLPKTAPLWQSLVGFCIIYMICYQVAKYLYRTGYIIKL